MKIANLSEEQLDYLVAKSLNWQWRYLRLLSEEGYVSWRSAEGAWGAWHPDHCSSWGNWHPDYCSSWAAIGPIMTAYGIFPEVNDFSQDNDGFITFDDGFFAKTPAQVLDGLDDGEWGLTPQIAVVRAYLVKTYGKEVDMPELELIP